MKDTLADESRRAWFSDRDKPPLDQLKFGCLQRIADATEAMAHEHRRLLAERDRLQQWLDEERAERKRLERSNRALRAHITRLRKKQAV